MSIRRLLGKGREIRHDTDDRHKPGQSSSSGKSFLSAMLRYQAVSRAAAYRGGCPQVERRCAARTKNSLCRNNDVVPIRSTSNSYNNRTAI